MLIPSRYPCQSCGEDIDTLIDTESGDDQELTEDCPVCCRPHRLVVRVFDDEVDIRAELE